MCKQLMFIVALVVLCTACASAYEISQIHLAQGLTPSSMTVMWVSPTGTSTESSCFYMAESSDGDFIKVDGTSESYVFDDAAERFEHYNSGVLHSCSITGLSGNTKYKYKVGSSTDNVMSAQLDFTTFPEVGSDQQVKLAVIGDLGQTEYSKRTVSHCAQSKPDMILHAGDLSYANCDMKKWDSYAEMVEPLASRVPWMVGPGNHEIEWTRGDSGSGLFKSFEARYKMPAVKAAEFGVITMQPYTACTPSTFMTEYDYGNSFYSFEMGLMHVTSLNCYAESDENSNQYKWLKEDLAGVDRTKTPWLVVMMHCPWYNSNDAHHNEDQTVAMKKAMEPLLYQNNVNVAFMGHVHAYERTYPTYQNQTNDMGTTYINIGDAGNHEGHATTYLEPTPEWSAYRNGTQYGHGTLTVFNGTTMEWEWHRNVDGEKVSQDRKTICNSYLKGTATC